MILGTYKRRVAPYFTGEVETFGTVLLSILLKSYGAPVLEWEGETIQLQVKEDFGVDMPRKVYDKLMAIVSALSSDTVYTDVAVFDETVNALCGRGVGAYRSVPPALEVAWSVTEIEMADPEPVGRSKAGRWSSEIKRYTRVVLDDSGLSIAPKTIAFAGDKPPSTHETSDPAIFAASWRSKIEAADEIDAQVAAIVQVMFKHLSDVGVQIPMEKVAEVLPDGTKIVKVDGNKVRNNGMVDFIGGGHNDVYEKIPKDEIWVEKDLKPEDQQKIVLHEVIERALMRQEGQSYEQAHATANKMEAKARNNDKTAEWTSNYNQEIHVKKHSPEFGTPENYLEAEKLHAELPAGDEVIKDVRCKFDDNDTSCTVSYLSQSRGTLHVRRLSDGKTVTLYKVKE